MNLKTIQQPIEKELAEFELYFKKAMKSQVSLLDKITYYLVKRKGKQVRPMFVFFSAKLANEINQATYTAAALVEIIHTATLVHDDVVDDSMKRRGFFSINALWKNKIAVLVGDYLFSTGLNLALQERQFEVLYILNKAIKELSEGELLQIEKARKLDIDEETYIQIVSDKTGALIAAACELGAITTTESMEDRKALSEFGENIGIAFQIKDDLFDFEGVQTIIGKTKGRDLKEQKITLPLIHAFTKAPRSETKRVLKMIKNDVSSSDVKNIIAFTESHGGLDYAKKRLKDYSDKAIQNLSHFKDSPAKEGLKNFVQFNMERNK